LVINVTIGKEQETILQIENVIFSGNRFKTYIGNIGELIAKEVLEKEGREIWMMGSYFADYPPEDEDFPGRPKSDRRKKRRGNLISALGLLYREQPRLPDERSLKKTYEIEFKGLDKARFHVPTWKDFKEQEQAKINMHKRVVKELKTFFGEKLENIKEYMCAIGPLRRTAFPRENPGERGTWYTPDLIAKKDDEMFVTEIKSNTGINYMRGQRLEGLLLAKKYKFVPMLITLNVSIGATHLVARKLE